MGTKGSLIVLQSWHKNKASSGEKITAQNKISEKEEKKEKAQK